MKTIYNKISNIINNMLEKVGYHFVGYKVDIDQNIFDIKAIREYKVGLYDFGIVQDDIKAIQLTIKSIREDYESLRTFHNNLSSEYVNNSASKVELNNLKNELSNRIDVLEIDKKLNEYDKKVNNDSAKTSLLNTPFKDDELNYDNISSIEEEINDIVHVQCNNAWKVGHYGEDITKEKEPNTIHNVLTKYIDVDKIAQLERQLKEYKRLLTSDNNYILEEIAKVLVPYDNDGININIDDIVDDINDKFNEFNNIFNDACDGVDNINLTNERG